MGDGLADLDPATGFLFMDIQKILIKNKSLSLKAVGLISYIAIHHGSMEGLDKKTLKHELNIGKDGLNSAFNELSDADIIQLVGTSIPGRFRYIYEVNEFYL